MLGSSEWYWLLLGFAKYEANAVGEIQTDTPALRWYSGWSEPASEILGCRCPGHVWNDWKSRAVRDRSRTTTHSTGVWWIVTMNGPWQAKAYTAEWVNLVFSTCRPLIIYIRPMSKTFRMFFSSSLFDPPDLPVYSILLVMLPFDGQVKVSASSHWIQYKIRTKDGQPASMQDAGCAISATVAFSLRLRFSPAELICDSIICWSIHSLRSADQWLRHSEYWLPRWS